MGLTAQGPPLVPTNYSRRKAARATNKGKAAANLRRLASAFMRKFKASLSKQSRQTGQPRAQLATGRGGDRGESRVLRFPPAAFRRFRRAKAAPKPQAGSTCNRERASTARPYMRMRRETSSVSPTSGLPPSPGRNHRLLPALAKNMPPACFLYASRPLHKGAFAIPFLTSLPCAMAQATLSCRFATIHLGRAVTLRVTEGSPWLSLWESCHAPRD